MGSIFLVNRSLSRKESLRVHLLPVIISGIALFAGLVLPLEKIPFRVCVFFRITGYPCPTCGLTRGFIALTHGNWMDAIKNCPLAVALYMTIAVVFVWNFVPLIFGVVMHRGSALKLRFNKIVWIIIISIIIIAANWFYRLGMGLD